MHNSRVLGPGRTYWDKTGSEWRLLLSVRLIVCTYSQTLYFISYCATDMCSCYISPLPRPNTLALVNTIQSFAPGASENHREPQTYSTFRDSITLDPTVRSKTGIGMRLRAHIYPYQQKPSLIRTRKLEEIHIAGQEIDSKDLHIQTQNLKPAWNNYMYLLVQSTAITQLLVKPLTIIAIDPTVGIRSTL